MFSVCEFSVKTGVCSLWYYMQRAQWYGVLRIKCSYTTANNYLVSYDGKQFGWNLRSVM